MQSVSPAYLKTNLLSGLTVALALVPEAIAFALVAHVSPLTGLYAAVLVSFITSAFGGRPGMISGAAGALAVVMVALVVEHGVQYLFAAIVLMGLFQMLFAAARLGKFIRMVPYPVMLGFVNGLALVIFIAQFGHFKIGGEWMQGAQLFTMLGLVAATMAVIYLTPRITKAVPATLVGILVVTAGAALLGIESKTVGDLGAIGGGLPQFALPEVPFNFDTLRIVLPYSLVLAGVGLIESLLTLTLVDEITETRGQPNRECMAQGTANIVTACFGGMGGCAMIGQSMINVNNGAYGRLSGIAASLFLLSFILFGSAWIEQIPLAALIGVMFVVCEKTFEWGTFRTIGKVPRADTLVVVLVAAITLIFDLAVAVLVGVIVSALVFAWQHAKQIGVKTSVDAQGWKVYELEGTLFFASIANFNELFTPKDDPQDVVVEFRRARVVDHSAIQAIDALAERYRVLGKRLHLRHLSADCRELLGRAQDMIEVNVVEDPRYRVADDKLG
ncbi:MULTISPECIES: SulP family inorganic anion transporter [unclassified Massilia]|uniref:SulP family inorganic anion transporter n=1 Tax=unclassified Massilia TaxID=2609279 RepID=UPI001785E530|nr:MULTISPECIES: SulP family inorganic anion transporter [unclassified Massilia]MBD8530803.1 SulP family inorganic anion transporter [Massilia sp. CFBP 13647]MBD8674502.1 SulP family inorganic anion transporter [Massilia sp. CFBP 13721]